MKSLYLATALAAWSATLVSASPLPETLVQKPVEAQGQMCAREFNGVFGVSVIPLQPPPKLHPVDHKAEAAIAAAEAAATASKASGGIVAPPVPNVPQPAENAPAAGQARLPPSASHHTTYHHRSKKGHKRQCASGSGGPGDGGMGGEKIYAFEPIGQIQPCGPPAQAPCPQPVSQIPDGQVQAPMGPGACPPMPQQPQPQPGPAPGMAQQIADGQMQWRPMKREERKNVKRSEADLSRACAKDDTLKMTLQDGKLIDSKGRYGYISSARQLQFDNPVQAGALIDGGFGACNDGYLSLGGTNVFYECPSGDFFNLYDQKIFDHCVPVHLQMVKPMQC